MAVVFISIYILFLKIRISFNLTMVNSFKCLFIIFVLVLFSSSCKDKPVVTVKQVSTDPQVQAAFDAFLKSVDNKPEITGTHVYENFIATKRLLNGEGVLLLYRKMGEYFYENEIPDSALIYFKEGLKLAKEAENNYYISAFHMLCGSVYTFVSDFEPALAELKASYNISLKLDSLKLQIRSSRYLGNVYWNIGNYDLALEYYLISLDISQKSNNEYGVAAALNNIGNVYLEIKNYDRAIDYFKLSIELAEKSDLEKVLALASNNMGNVFLLKEKYDSALVFFQIALVNIKKIDSKYDEGIYIGNIADVYLKTDSLEKSKEYFHKSLDLAAETGDKTGMASCNLGLADVDIRQNNLPSALQFLKTGTEISEEIGSLKLLDYAYNLNSKYFLTKNDFPQSHHFLTKQMSVKDSMYSLENGESVARLENQYKEVKSIKEIELLKEKQKNFLYLAVLGFSAFIIISLLILLAYRQKAISNKILSEKNQQIELNRGVLEEKNQQLIKSQDLLNKANRGKDDFLTIISHDLKNPLSSIRGFTELLVQNYDELSDDKRKQFLNEVFDSIERISLLITNILFWVKTHTDGISIRTEEFPLSRRIEDNVSIYRLILANKEITVENNVPHNIKVLSDINVFDMIIRNILSNAIKYSNAKGLISISSNVEGSNIKITISDTGVGIPKDKIDLILQGKEQFTTTGTRHEQGTGLGLGLSIKFIEQIGGKFEIDSEEGKGTSISFTLKSSG